MSIDDYSSVAELAGRRPGVDGETVVRCWRYFDRTKARVGKVDFADLLDLAANLIEGDENIAHTVRLRWAHVTVDEYQDCDAAQQRLLDAVLGDGHDICVVGDPRQAIYSWKGADPRYLTGFTRRYPDARVFQLTQNYRSTKQVLNWANRVARGAHSLPLVATRPDGPRPRVSQLENEQAEAAWVAGAARHAVSLQTPVSEIAVLYRFNATQARFEAAFARAGIPTVIEEDTTFFERDEIRAVLVPFGQAARAQPDRDGLDLLAAVLSRAGFDRDKPPTGLGAARARWESQQALLELLEGSLEAGTPDARSLLAEVNSLAVSTQGPRTAGLTLSTLHRAKGLEWDIVFLVGMSDGAMPSSYAVTPEEVAEEERLLHVGVTRARRELHVTWATANARGWKNRPSPFLELLLPTPKRPQRQRADARPTRGRLRAVASGAEGGECPHCAAPLKGIAARRLEVCPDCVMSVPGATGERARALAEIIGEAARNKGVGADVLVSPPAVLRLLDRRPGTAEDVAATAGVGLRGGWAQAAAEILKA